MTEQGLHLQGNGSFLFMEVYSWASGKIGFPLRSARNLWKTAVHKSLKVSSAYLDDLDFNAG